MLTLTKNHITVSPASVNDAPDLAKLAVMASDGLTKLTWNGMRQAGETALDVGIRRAKRKTGGFSYLNADIACDRQKVVAAVVSFPIEPQEFADSDAKMPAFFRPLAELERKAVSTWCINILATYPEARGQGAATALILEVEERAKSLGYTRLSLIVRDENPASHLYRNIGFREVARSPIVQAGIDIPLQGKDWLLMVKALTINKTRSFMPLV